MILKYAVAIPAIPCKRLIFFIDGRAELRYPQSHALSVFVAGKAKESHAQYMLNQ